MWLLIGMMGTLGMVDNPRSWYDEKQFTSTDFDSGGTLTREPEKRKSDGHCGRYGPLGRVSERTADRGSREKVGKTVKTTFGSTLWRIGASIPVPPVC